MLIEFSIQRHKQNVTFISLFKSSTAAETYSLLLYLWNIDLGHGKYS